MNCDEARDLLLEADLTDPSLGESWDLAQHLSACSACRAVADTFKGIESLLQEEIDLAAAAGAARVESTRSTRPILRRWRIPQPIAIPIATAASITTLFLLMSSRSSDGEPSLPSLLNVETVSVVEVPEGRGAAIFRTPDPNITVVWIYQENGR